MFVFGFRPFFETESGKFLFCFVVGFRIFWNGVRKIFIRLSLLVSDFWLFELFIIQTYNQACLLEHFSDVITFHYCYVSTLSSDNL